MPAHGTIIAALDDENVCDVLDGAPCKVVGYGVGDGEHGFRAVDLDAGPAGTAFRVLRDEHEVARAVVPMYGRHNVANALGALATAVALGVVVLIVLIVIVVLTVYMVTRKRKYAPLDVSQQQTSEDDPLAHVPPDQRPMWQEWLKYEQTYGEKHPNAPYPLTKAVGQQDTPKY
jgi:UDP-N-acetylmuramate-alanine ligase